MPTSKKDLVELTKLGKQASASKQLEAFPNHAPKGQMSITIHCHEFTCICPLTKQPDYAVIDIIYDPDECIVESKSLKLYLETYRTVGIFHEHLAVEIGEDFVKAIKPHKVEVIVSFNARGGVAIAAKYRWEKAS